MFVCILCIVFHLLPFGVINDDDDCRSIGKFVQHTIIIPVYSISWHVPHCIVKQESCAIAGRTARCRCKFRYVGLSKFTISR